VAAALLASAASFVGESLLRDQVDWSMAAASKSALYVLAAVIAAVVVARLRDAEREISVVRAREDMARTLHDGVLQTLAAIQRRSADPELRALAGEQDRELRSLLFEAERPLDTLPVALRRSGDAVARRHGIDAEVVLADDLPDLDDASSRALVGAVTEALTNAAKHSGARRVVVYAEPDEDEYRVFCSIRDDGTGFDVNRVTMGEGMRRSIRDRMADAGGRVEIDSQVGRGTEVRLWAR
jgi:signal transduction histidine kinase